MSNDRIALIAVVLASVLIGGIEHMAGASGAPVVVPRYQIAAGSAVNNPQNGVVSMLWFIGEDGKVKVCEGSDRGVLSVTCSPAVTP